MVNRCPWFSISSIQIGRDLASIADEQVLYLTTIGRTTGLPREIEIWFVVCRERFYLLAETGEAAGWVKNIRRNPRVVLRIAERQIDAMARVVDKSNRSQTVGRSGCNRRSQIWMGRRAAGENHAASLTPHPIIPSSASGFAEVAELASWQQ